MNTIEQLAETITGIGKAFEEFKQIIDTKYAAKSGVQKAVADALTEAKVDQIQQTLDDLSGKKEDLERRIKAEEEERKALNREVELLRAGARPGAIVVDEKSLADFNLHVKQLARDRGRSEPATLTVDDVAQYKRAFASWMRKEASAVSDAERKAMQVGVDADGGIFVAPDTGGRIVQRVYELSPMRQICAVQAIGSDRLTGVADIGEAADGWVGEVQARSDTATPQSGAYEIPVFEQYAQPKASQKTLDDASIDIEAWLQAKVANRFARREALAFIQGNGTSQPRGFASYITAASDDASRAWGQLEHIATGVSSNFAASNPADQLFDLEMAFKPAYLANARIVTRRQVIRLIRKFKDSTGQYLWQPSLQQGQPATLIGYGLVMCEDMPALANGSLSLAMGDFAEGYQIVDRLGIRVIRDNLTDKPNVKFYTIRRVGGAVLNFEAIKFIKFS